MLVCETHIYIYIYIYMYIYIYIYIYGSFNKPRVIMFLYSLLRVVHAMFENLAWRKLAKGWRKVARKRFLCFAAQGWRNTRTHKSSHLVPQAVP